MMSLCDKPESESMRRVPTYLIWFLTTFLFPGLAITSFAATPCYENFNKANVSELKAPFIVSCGSKGTCLPTDQLEIRPADPAGKGPVEVCLSFRPTNASTGLPVFGVDAAKNSVLSYPLSPLINEWLDPNSAKEFTDIRNALVSAHNGYQRVDVMLKGDGEKLYKVTISLDLTSLWSTGAIRPTIARVVCKPCEFGGRILVAVPQLATWKAATRGDPSKLNLVIAGTKVPGLEPAVSTSDGTLVFPIQRTTENASAWAPVLAQLLAASAPRIKVGIADEKGTMDTHETLQDFNVAPKRFQLTVTFGVFFFVVMLFIGINTSFKWLRDVYDIPDQLIKPEQMPMSLGKSQMFFWTIAIAIAWFAIGVSTSDWLGLGGSALTLLALSVGTGMGSMAIGEPSHVAKLKSDYANRKGELSKAAESLTASITDESSAKLLLQTSPTEPTLILAAADAQKNVLAAQAIRLRADADFIAAKTNLVHGITSNSWFADVTADYGETMGIHRVQNMLFTLVFGGYFVWQSYATGTMPTLSSEMLTLLGISGSAYVGFKLSGR